MRVLVTGATGQAGSALLATLQNEGHDTIACSRRAGHVRIELDEPDTMRKAIQGAGPDWVVHCAAMTDVEACEAEPGAADRRNHAATEAVARSCAEVGARLLYVSTDYVFDGEAGDYHEDCVPSPVCAYGRSKANGEAAANIADAVIARTSVLFDASHRNFVSWIRDALRAGQAVRVVTDQTASPTHASDLAAQLVTLMEADATGIWHTAGADRCSRYEVACQLADQVGADPRLIEPIRCADMGWSARRPVDSSLDVGKVSRIASPWPLSRALEAAL